MFDNVDLISKGQNWWATIKTTLQLRTWLNPL